MPLVGRVNMLKYSYRMEQWSKVSISKMVELAKRRNKNSGEFFVHDLSDRFDSMEDYSCDIVLCALALHYLEDWTYTIQAFHRVLKP